MKIGIIGAGKVGCSIAFALKQKGYKISGIYSRSIESASYLAEMLMLPLKNDLKEVIVNSDIIFITTSDKEISNVAEKICHVQNSDILNKVFFHCSGALNSDELEILNHAGAYTGSFHPIQTFADKETGWIGLKDIYFGFEGSSEAKVYAEKIADILNCKILILEKEAKILYHTAACILSNYTVTLFYMAEGLFEKIGLDREIGIKAFLPLVKQTITNINTVGSLNALTGPVSRGDYLTVEKHLKELEKKFPELLEFYKMMGIKTVEAARNKGSLKDEGYEKLNKLLL